MLSKRSMPKCLSASVPFLLCASVPLCLYAFIYSGCSKENKTDLIQEATSFSLFDVDSVQYNLADYHGKIVLLHFWADWCPHCRQELAKLQKAGEELKGKGLEILAVNVGQGKEHVSELKREFRLIIPLLLDDKKEIAGKYGVTGLPTSVFINQNGLIKEKQIGWLSEEQVRLIFEKIAAEN